MPDEGPQDEATANERTRLLPANPQSAHDSDASIERYTGTFAGIRLRLLAILLMQFLPTFAYFHLIPSRLQLLEQSLCRRYYEIRDPSLIQQIETWPYYQIEESACKERFIQSNLSNVRSWQLLYDGLCLFIVSVPYGLVADRFGTAFVYVLGLVGFVFYNAWYVTMIDSPSINTILVSTVFLFIGGGTLIAQTMAITMGIVITSEELRSTVLYLQLSAYYLGYITASAVAPLSMRMSWLPFVVALAVLCIATFIALTSSFTKVASQENDIPDENSERQSHESDEGRSCCSICSPSEALKLARQNPLLTCTLALFPIQATRNSFSELVMSYVAERYGWQLRQAAILDSINGIIALILGFTALPGLVKLLNRYVGVPTQTDCLVAICSATAYVVGSIVVAVAPTIGVMLAGWVTLSLGFGIRMSILSIAASLVTSEQIGRLNTLVVSIETMSDIIISPLIWRAWSTGLELEDEAALGLPWFVLAAVMIIVIIALVVLYRALVRRTQDSQSDFEPS